jgi:hypothetical protein
MENNNIGLEPIKNFLPSEIFQGLKVDKSNLDINHLSKMKQNCFIQLRENLQLTLKQQTEIFRAINIEKKGFNVQNKLDIKINLFNFHLKVELLFTDKNKGSIQIYNQGKFLNMERFITHSVFNRVKKTYIKRIFFTLRRNIKGKKYVYDNITFEIENYK